MKFIKAITIIIFTLILATIFFWHINRVVRKVEAPVKKGQEYVLKGSINVRFDELNIGNGGTRLQINGVPSANLFFHLNGKDSQDQRQFVYAGWSGKIDKYTVFVEEIEVNRFFGNGRIRLRVWKD